MDYQEFLQRKHRVVGNAGIRVDVNQIHPKLFDFQKAIKGHKTEATRFSLADVAVIINTSALNIARPWTKAEDDRVCKRIKETGYERVKYLTNDFLRFFFGIAGSEKKVNPAGYRRDAIRAIVFFYKLLNDQGFFSNENARLNIAGKMSQYLFNADFLRMEHSSKIASLVAYFNSRKKAKRVIYDGRL